MGKQSENNERTINKRKWTQPLKSWRISKRSTSQQTNLGVEGKSHEENLINLREENHILKDDEKALNVRMDNFGCILADLNNKLKVFEEQKASLLPTIRL